MMRSALIMSCLGITLAAPAIAASPADLANQHIAAVAAGDVTKILAAYSPDSILNWVGGPLDGTYIGPAQLSSTWSKFSKQAPLTFQISRLAQNANPAGATVTADVIFQGKKTIKVHYVLLYRAGALVDEIWQIDPKLPH